MSQSNSHTSINDHIQICPRISWSNRIEIARWDRMYLKLPPQLVHLCEIVSYISAGGASNTPINCTFIIINLVSHSVVFVGVNSDLYSGTAERLVWVGT